jgi:hypothetical protein
VGLSHLGNTSGLSPEFHFVSEEMPRPRKRGVHLTRRDLEVMEQLVIRRAETLDWIHGEFFDGLSRKRVLNRLGELVAAGYLGRVTVTVPGAARPESAYTLGPKGKTSLELRSLSGEHFRHRRFNPILRDSSIPHQIVVNRVADFLGADLIPEHLLSMPTKEGWRHKPDGVYVAAEADGRGPLVWLEVDLGHYSRDRLLGKLRAFHEAKDAGRFLIVTHTPTRANQIASWLRGERSARGALVILSLGELIANPEHARAVMPASGPASSDPYEALVGLDWPRAAEADRWS